MLGSRFLDGGGLALDEAADGELVAQPHPLPPSATRKGPLAGEASSTETLGAAGASAALATSAERGGRGRGGGVGLGTGPGARQSEGSGWADGAARRREARREEAASEEWVNSTRTEVAKLCEIASKPFWQV